MSSMETTRVLRIVDGGMAQPNGRTHGAVRPAQAATPRTAGNLSRWMDFAPMTLLGLMAGVASVWQVAASVAR